MNTNTNINNYIHIYILRTSARSCSVVPNASSRASCRTVSSRRTPRAAASEQLASRSCAEAREAAREVRVEKKSTFMFSQTVYMFIYKGDTSTHAQGTDHQR